MAAQALALGLAWLGNALRPAQAAVGVDAVLALAWVASSAVLLGCLGVGWLTFVVLRKE